LIRAARILAALLAAYGIAYAAESILFRHSSASDPHAALRDPSRCVECHIDGRPEAGRPYRQMIFRQDIYSLCTRCHASHVTHPIDIAPRRGISGMLPLDSDGTMTCITCHAPHSAPISSRRHTGRPLLEKIRDTVFPHFSPRFRTYFLRVPNPEGELCGRCHTPGAIASKPSHGRIDTASYAGSRTCSRCHRKEYAEWRRSPHARMLRSPKNHPDALLAKFDNNTPFPPSEIAYILGSRTAQRFISRKGDALVVRTPIWIIREGKWNLGYWREPDWRKSCAGCHVTGYDPSLPAFVEEGVGCEACHGPGRAHAESGGVPGKIVHPGKLSSNRRTMICESCHTTGHDMTGEYRFPVGYQPGGNLAKHFQGLIPKPGQDDTTFRGDGSYADRRAQFAFWASRMLIVEGETCDLCKNFRGGPDRIDAGSAPEKMSAREFCLSCHDGRVLPPPRHHGREIDRAGECLSCHPVARIRGGSPSVHDHKYLPEGALAGKDFLPRPDFRSICFGCHPSPPKGA